MKRLMMLAVAVAAAMMARAETETVGDYTWTYHINGDTTEITTGYWVSPAISPSPIGAVTIPSTLGGKPVTSIGTGAFSGCSRLTSVTIPDGVTSIESYAFRNCSGLTNVTIPDGVTSIGSYAFSNCSGLTNVTIPDGVTSIGGSAFSGCSGLTGMTIPDSVTSIGEQAFYGCSGLANVTIPDSVTSIGVSAFSGCSASLYDTSSIPGVKLVDCWAVGHISALSGALDLTGVCGVADRAFEACSGLTSVTIPDSVTSIGDSAFSGCSGLTSVTIPDSVKRIGEDAFSGCSGLTSVTGPLKGFSSFSHVFSGYNNLALVISDGATSIWGDVFRGCSGLTSVTIPDSVTYIGSYAFCGCSGLTSVTIPDSVKRIWWGAFSGCSGLTSVTIPDGVTSIGEWAFHDCSGLTSVTIPDSVTSIGEGAFHGCSGLTSVTIGNSVTSIGEDAFSGCSGLTSVTIGNSVTSIGKCAFESCSRLTSVTIPNSVTSIGSYAFYYCSGLTSVTIGNSVTSIGGEAFRGCSGLTSVTIGNSVTSIGEWAFYGCSGLTGVTIPDSVTSIGEYAFDECRGLTSVTIGNGVTNIGEWAFLNCLDLTTVRVSPGDSNRVKTLMANSVFDVARVSFIEIGMLRVGFDANGGNVDESGRGVESGSVVGELPTPMRTGYSFTGWWTMAIGGAQVSASTIVTEAVTYYAHWTANQYTMTFNANGGSVGESNRSVAYGSAVGELPKPTRSGYTFDGWFTAASGGAQVSASTIVTGAATYYAHWTKNVEPDPEPEPGPEPIWTIDSNGVLTGVDLNGCTDIVIPDGVTSIGERAFCGCSGLTSVTIPASVTNIGDSAFKFCSGLTRLTIPDGVTSICHDAFECCTSLYSVTIPASVKFIGECAFESCDGLYEVHITDLAKWCEIHFDGDEVCSNPLYYARRLYLNGSLVGGNLEIPSGTTRVGSYTFCGCSWLANVAIPDSVASIGDGAFSECSGLTSVMIPDSVTSIGSYAFSYCSGLTSMTIPDSVTSIGYGAFEETPFYDNLPDGLVMLGRVAYKMKGACPASVVIPNGIASIGDGAFEYCRELASVTIPDSVTSIGEKAFTCCSGLTNITIPDSVERIGDRAFSACSGLMSVTIPDSVKSIEEGAFYNCSGLTSVTIPDSVTSIGYDAFYKTPFYNNLTDGLVVLGKVAYKMKGSCPASVEIPAGIVSIADNAFNDCSGLTSVTIPDSVMRIGNSAFSDCRSLLCVTIGNGVTSIGESAFDRCYGLTSVTIPDSVTSIGMCAFGGCSGLTSVTIPDSVASIGDGAFSDCVALKDIYVSPGDTDRIKGLMANQDMVFDVNSVNFIEIGMLRVVFDANGGKVSTTTRSVSSGVAIGDLPIPTRSGYLFLGWFTSASGGTKVTATTVVRASVTYYAHWRESSDPVNPDPVKPDPVNPDPVNPDPVTPVVSTFTVSFDANAGNVSPTSRKVDDGAAVGALPTPTRSGYTFDGWFTAKTGGTKIGAATKVSGNVTYYAHWTMIVVNYGGVLSDVAFAKAQAKSGVLYDAKGNLVGTVELKFGKISLKKGTVKVSGTATMIIDGKAKKVSAKAANMPVDADGSLRDALVFKAPIGEMTFAMGADGVFTLKNGAYEMVGAVKEGNRPLRQVGIGGTLAKSQMKFNVELDAVPDFGKDGELLEDALPEDEPVYVAGGLRWSFDKAASLKYKKNKATGAYELLGLDDPKKPNLSGLKLSYTAKTGIFKGTFKLYATNETTTPAGKSPKLKAYTVIVIGFVVDGVGYGEATLKKPAATWPVTVE